MQFLLLRTPVLIFHSFPFRKPGHSTAFESEDNYALGAFRATEGLDTNSLATGSVVMKFLH